MVKRELLPASDLRRNLFEKLDQVEREGRHFGVLRRSRAAALLVPVDWYNRACEALGDPPL